jgi:hypothetical protein
MAVSSGFHVTLCWALPSIWRSIFNIHDVLHIRQIVSPGEPLQSETRHNLHFNTSDSMDRSLSWEVDRRTRDENIPNILQKPNIRFCVYKNSLLDPLMSVFSPVHTLTYYFITIRCNTTNHTYIYFSQIASAFSEKFYEWISDLQSACCMPHPSHHTSWSHFNNMCELHKLWNS